jgi:hypothetical protein
VSDYTWLPIDAPDDYHQLTSMLDAEFDPSAVAERLRSCITTSVRGVLIEREYVDRDYRSTFYRFYAKKGRPYRDDCVRLHFFGNEVSFDPLTTNLIIAAGEVKHHYYGFMVLRPTLIATIGRTILSPDVRAGARGHVIYAEHHVHLLGHRLTVFGFPSMSQHVDISVCAHVSCWAILRHYSERYAEHRELLLHDITMMAQQFDPGGLTPALGLNVSEAERIFQAAGTYPVIVAKKHAADLGFYAQMIAYLESGFPLFVAMKNQRHAIVVAGHAWRETPKAPPHAITHAWEQVQSVITVDDNMLPYGCVPVSASGGSAPPTSGSPSYSAEDFDAFIVPLPEKIFYSAGAMESYSTALHALLGSIRPMPPANDLLRRYFITTISALRRYAREHQSQLGDELVNMLMRLRTAQFIWVVEYATHAQWANGHITARAVVDATASARDPLPAWFAHDEQHGILFDRSTAKIDADIVPLKRQVNTPLGRMEQNLRPIKPLP